MKKVYEKYEVKSFTDLVRHFEMKTSVSIEDLDIEDSSVFHSAVAILNEVKENNYNPLQEQILIYSTFLNAFYNLDYKEFAFIMEEVGTFRTYYLFKEVLSENQFFKEFVILYNNYIERLNNLGIILIKEGKELINTVKSFISGISPETIADLIKELEDGLLKTEILNELNIKRD